MNERSNERPESVDKESRPIEKRESHAAAKGAVAGTVAGGVAGGAVTGALAGGLTGPVGAAIGAAAGAVVGALAGKATEDKGYGDSGVVNDGGAMPLNEPDSGEASRLLGDDDYWRDNWSSRPYARSDATYDDYSPAYRYGAEAHNRYPGQHFDDIEPDLERDWQGARGTSSLEWEHARHASRDAWQRVKEGAERAMPGDSDGDGL
jgi:hypothetical protein